MKISFCGSNDELHIDATLNNREDCDYLVKMVEKLSGSIWPYRDPAPKPPKPPTVHYDYDPLAVAAAVAEAPPAREEPF